MGVYMPESKQSEFRTQWGQAKACGGAGAGRSRLESG